MADIRLLKADDLGACMALKDAAGWNQTEEDWRMLLELSPDGCFGIDVFGRLAATTTVIAYGQELAWVGMVLTAPDQRGRGYARALMEHAIAYCEQHGIHWIKLDATDMGRPLYLKLGFMDESPIERWRRSPGPLRADFARSASTLPLPLGVDYAAFGADRTRLLRRLERFASVTAESGHAFIRPGARATYLGPCVAETPATARDLLLRVLVRHCFEPVFWDLLPRNEAAAALAREFGFARERQLVRMARPGTNNPQALAYQNELVFAIAGFEYG